LTPDEFYAKPEGARKFMLASMMLEIEVEDKLRKETDKKL
jgi:hypothetical protein